MIEPLDISQLEEAWGDYQNDDSYNDIGKLNLVAWMGERVGLMLQEIRMLRTQVESLQATLAEERQANEDVHGWTASTAVYE